MRHYTATDLDYLVPLIRKNVILNTPALQQELYPLVSQSPRRQSDMSNHSFDSVEARITIEALDWTELHATTPHRRSSLFRLEHADPPDFIVVADCIYNPALLPALVEVINHYTRTDHTRVLVAVELRSEDVLREFLELWLSSGAWELWRIEKREDGMDTEVNERKEPEDLYWLGYEFAIWLGWKTSSSGSQSRA